MRGSETLRHESARDGRSPSSKSKFPPECRPPLASYLSRIRQYPRLTRAQEQQLAQKSQGGSSESCKELVRSNLSFVVKVANGYRDLGLPLEDLIDEGNVGLIEAARRFDPSVGTKFITYASWWIRKRIFKALADQSRLVRVPESHLKREREIRDAENILGHDLGAQPAREMISTLVKKSLPSIDRTLRLRTKVLSLDHSIGECGELALSDRLADSRLVDPEGALIDQESIKLLNESLKCLRNQERDVVTHRFGLQTGKPLTLKEIGQKMRISRERVRQIECQAKARLRRIFESRTLVRPPTCKKLKNLR